jgi:hypothetical protein
MLALFFLLDFEFITRPNMQITLIETKQFFILFGAYY